MFDKDFGDVRLAAAAVFVGMLAGGCAAGRTLWHDPMPVGSGGLMIGDPESLVTLILL